MTLEYNKTHHIQFSLVHNQDSATSPNLKCKHYNLPTEMLHYQSILTIYLSAKILKLWIYNEDSKN